ncbi:TetR/AcrR family transcriptional regulator [Polyangium mundeleinium]|uniref:TetR/AcrR family transcriptional regulator n=1 Tax=Polyangium mundeleinium TaxID=2995306 RepID=A0ABT5ES11_9BACT|nr:TetR/AcrR family transcriptional regulator [Polyangium mundeleinium]MDC0744598.1 TetR/AcrR family transcriptional regulator [Polyangium mundeleinium]
MKEKPSASERRALVRGEPVVRGVLAATLEELAEVGYEALRIEDVATRAGVNKTTVYRRWPTKQDLVRAAFRSITVDRAVTPDTGSLRGDLIVIARHIATQASSPELLGLRRLLFAEDRDADLVAIAQSIHESMEALPRPVIEAAEARGELAPGIDATLIFRSLAATIHHRLGLERRPIDEGFLAGLVELLLVGALAPDKRA